MPPGYTDEGVQAAIAIRRDHPGTGVLVFSQYIETATPPSSLERHPAAVPPASDTCSRTASATSASSSTR
jgi:hypothetical protein